MKPDPKTVSLCKTIGKALGIDPRLLYAITQREGPSPFSIRYEPGFYEHYIRPIIAKEKLTPTEAMARAFSWGPMQVMGQVARERGFKGQFLSELCDPERGLWYGAKHLALLLNRHDGHIEKAVSAYNHGSPAKDLKADPYLYEEGPHPGVMIWLEKIKEAWPE